MFAAQASGIVKRMPVIEVDGLVKRYGDLTAVDGVSMTVNEGEIFGILGPNGAGKTTTVESITGLRRADAGRIRVLGLDPVIDRDQLRRLVGVQLQESRQPDRITVEEAVNLFASFYPDPVDPHGLLAELGLAQARRRRFKELSGGMQQRLSIALALVGNPQVAVLDELTTGLDPHARRETWSLIERVRDRGVTIVLVTHIMEEAERLCDRLALLAGGRVIASGTPAALVAEVAAPQRIRFAVSSAVDLSVIAALPEVTAVEQRGTDMEVTGIGDVLPALLGLLSGMGVVAHGLRVNQGTLDDAFLALTGRRVSDDGSDLMEEKA